MCEKHYQKLPAVSGTPKEATQPVLASACQRIGKVLVRFGLPLIGLKVLSSIDFHRLGSPPGPDLSENIV
jgi:hypothetical protein